MNTFSLVFSVIGIVAIVFMFGNQAFAYDGYGDYGGYPYGGYYDLGHHHPKPTVTSPITRKTYRCSVTATTTPSASKGD